MWLYYTRHTETRTVRSIRGVFDEPTHNESALAKALGHFVGSKRAVSEIPERLSHASAAFRTRDLRGFDLASLCMDTVYEPLHR
jgi:hypothetical protein